MDRNVSTRVPPSNPLGKLLAANRLGLKQGAVAIIHVLEDAIHNVGPQLLVVRVGQLVVNDLGKHVAITGQLDQPVEFLQRQNRRLLDEDMFSGFQGLACNLEVAIVGRRHADCVEFHQPRGLEGKFARVGARASRRHSGDVDDADEWHGNRNGGCSRGLILLGHGGACLW